MNAVSDGCTKCLIGGAVGILCCLHCLSCRVILKHDFRDRLEIDGYFALKMLAARHIEEKGTVVLSYQSALSEKNLNHLHKLSLKARVLELQVNELVVTDHIISHLHRIVEDDNFVYVNYHSQSLQKLVKVDSSHYPAKCKDFDITDRELLSLLVWPCSRLTLVNPVFKGGGLSWLTKILQVLHRPRLSDMVFDLDDKHHIEEEITGFLFMEQLLKPTPRSIDFELITTLTPLIRKLLMTKLESVQVDEDLEGLKDLEGQKVTISVKQLAARIRVLDTVVQEIMHNVLRAGNFI